MFAKQLRSVYPLVAITATFTILIIGIPLLSLLTVFLLTTQLWPIALFYLVWILVIDRDTCDRGGRPLKYFRNLSWFLNTFNYFPVETKKLVDFDLDPARNYLLCVFPHGVLPAGLSGAMLSDVVGCKRLFPKHNPYLLMIRTHFFVPFLREMLLSLGCCSCSKKSMNWVLDSSKNGNIAGMSIGGGTEAFSCIPGKHTITLKNKKGFIKMAILNGAPLLPAYSFGETDLFETVELSKTSTLGKIQSWLLKKTDIGFVIFKGRSIFNIHVPFIPRQKPVNVIIGRPIEVIKNTHPTQEDIDNLHNKFIMELHDLFENAKHKYVSNPENAQLIIQ